MKNQLYTAALALAAVPALAAEPASVKVGYSDLNLASAEGVAALDRRVDRALRRLCGGPSTHVVELALTKRCRAEALAQVEPQRLAALDAARGVQLAAK